LHKRSSQGRARRVQVNETAAATGGTALEIVFVSSDRSESEMLSYMCESHGDWLGLSFREQTLKKQLSDKYGVRGIPMLVVVNAHDGSLITAEGTQDVEAGGSFCFQRWLGRMTQP
jgi:nucleoredoxin